MELFVGIIAIVFILFVLHVSHAPEEPKLELQGGTARLTPTEATQLNRIFVLQGSAPTSPWRWPHSFGATPGNSPTSHSAQD